MDLCIVGAGHVGLVTGACFADLGNHVICVDNDRARIAGLKAGRLPIYEPGLEELVKRNVLKRRLSFTDRIAEGVKDSLVIFIAVGTPPKEGGEPDLTAVEHVAHAIAKAMASYRLIVEKSTVPVETGAWVAHTIRLHARKGVKFDVASNPEFLREGSAIHDFMHPDRIVLGVEGQRAKELLLELYKPLKAKVLVTDIKSAELIKHASNSFLALKLSFINAIAQLCERVGADALQVAQGIGMDPRIGAEYLNPGPYGGACLPKDIDAFIWIARKLGYDFELLEAVKRINDQVKQTLVRKIEQALWNLKGKQIGLLGLSFKPNTDDMRLAPAIDVITALQREGARLKVYDPQAIAQARLVFNHARAITYCQSPYEAAKGSDCLIVMTEWNEFKDLDLKRLKRLLRQPLIVDARNIYDSKEMTQLGFRYLGVGRAMKQAKEAAG